MAERFPPEGACDCHAHVVGPKAKYPLVSPRAYTPMDAPLRETTAMMDRLGLARIVLVQTSVFGTDNRCMTDALAALGERGRGIAQVDDDVADDMLKALHAAGVRGLRVNLNTMGLNDPVAAADRVKRAADLCERRGWHVQLFTSADVVAALSDVIADLPVPVCFDHFALLSVQGHTPDAEAATLDLLRAGRAFVKISGTYRLDAPDETEAIAALAKRLYEANPRQIVWGSDWPHTPPHPAGIAADESEAPYRDLDTAALLGTVRDWFDEPRAIEAILVDNPARLYDF